jgi:undecaprenyl diphosphate synthase
MDLASLDPKRIPRHVACVMDGNGRWATKRGLPRTEGHRAGEEALLEAATGAVELGIEWFTVYAFSTENWRRPHEEVRFLLNVIADDLLTRRRDELHALGVRIRFAGRRDWRMPKWIVRRMDETTELTRHNKAMTLTVAFNYGGRAEIVDAIRGLVAEGVKPSQVDERAVRRHLYNPEMPDPDLFIRTSGEYRISNFLLWEHLRQAVWEYQQRERRFGLTGDQKDHDGLPS